METTENDPDFSVVGGTGVLLDNRIVCCGGTELSVTRGYRWNGSNIPRWLQWLFGTPFDAVHAIPSLDHDRIYEVGYMYSITRREADSKYLDDIISRGQNRVLAFLEWLNVRIFGRRYWTG